MDINDIRGLGTVFALFSFLCVVAWAYSSSRKNRFDDDGHIPFKDDNESLDSNTSNDTMSNDRHTRDEKDSE